MYLLVHNLENRVDFVYKELGTCPNFQHMNLISEERHKNVWGGVGRRLIVELESKDIWGLCEKK